MKKFNIFLIVSAILLLILAACGGNNDVKGDNEEVDAEETTALEYEPEDINADSDVCEICAMAVADDQYATQIILENDRSLKFDDLGCLYEWVEENDEDEVGAKFVRDFNTEEWILLEDATYVFDEEIETPMAYGVISFKEKTDAEQYIEDNGFGELLTANDLADHKWEMMGHDHDHGDHDHGDHDEHGFHTEGFDMHMTELDNLSTGETNELAVHITLDEKDLEDAKVRYEIWLENDEDNTDWIDAEEAAAGNYTADYAFEEAGTYHIQIHVEDDEDLHEHMEVEVEVEA